MKKVHLTLFVMAALLSICLPAMAQETATKPVLVVSFSGYDAIKQDVGLLGKLGGNPDMAQGLEGMLAMATQGEGVKGLDKTRPWGMVVETDASGASFPASIFIPVEKMTDMGPMLESLGFTIGEEGDGVYSLSHSSMPEPLYAQEKGTWAYVTRQAEELKSVPADPAALLGDLPKKYDLAVKVIVENIPESLKQQGIAQLQMGAEIGMQQQPGESDEDFALRKKVGTQGIEQILKLVEDMKDMTIALAIDDTTETIYLDVEVTAKPDTDTAKDLALIKKGPSAFSGFVMDEAAVTMQAVGTLSESDKQQQLNMIKSVEKNMTGALDEESLSDEQRETAKKLAARFFEIAAKAIEEGKQDFAMSAVLDPSGMTMVAGAYLPNAKDLESALGDLIEVAKKEEPKVSDALTVDAATVGDVTLHKVEMPIPDDADNAEMAKQLLGEKVTAWAGFTEDRVYLAIGKDGEAMLKKAIEQSAADASKEVLPFRMTLSSAKLAAFIAAVAEEDQVKGSAMMAAMVLSQAGSDDHLVITGEPVENGTKVRIELEKGIIKTAAAMLKSLPLGGPQQ